MLHAGIRGASAGGYSWVGGAAASVEQSDGACVGLATSWSTADVVCVDGMLACVAASGADGVAVAWTSSAWPVDDELAPTPPSACSDGAGAGCANGTFCTVSNVWRMARVCAPGIRPVAPTTGSNGTGIMGWWALAL